MSDWIEWKGGECPVAEDTLVEVRLSGINSECTPTTAGSLYWNMGSIIGSIIAYRVCVRSEIAPPASPAATPRTDAWEQEMYAQDSCLITEPTFPEMLAFARTLERESAALAAAIRNLKGEARCSHGKGLTDYCEPCGRIHGSAK